MKLDFEDKEYEGVTFKDEFITEEVFANCTFKNCRFVHCTLFKCNFKHCAFISNTFERCDISVCSFKESRVEKMTLIKTKAVGIDWSGKFKYKLEINFEGCVINLSSFAEVTLKNFILKDCTAHDCDFQDASAPKGNFTGTDLKGSQFLRTDLREANFTNARNYIINPLTNKIAKGTYSVPDAYSFLDLLGINLVE